VVSKLRAQRIGDRIREELSEMLIYEIADPRLSGVSVTDVRVDRELTYASIFVSALEGSDRAEEILDALNHARGYLRSELARRIELRSFPHLRFNWDPTFERAERIERLIASLNTGEASDHLGEDQAAVTAPEEQDQDDIG
jgi:ribosome-binding factor A